MTVETESNSINVAIFSTAEEASREVARRIAGAVNRRPDGVLGLATGGTPVTAYQALIGMYRDGKVDFSNIRTFNLDEYIGLPPDHPQSFRHFMDQQLFQSINVDPERTFVPDGLASDVAQACSQYEAMIRDAGGIDLQLLGIGHNGHIAFNEPGSAADSRTRQVALTDETIENNARFFESIDQVPRHAITMGIGTILEAREIVLLALGEGKAEAVAKMVHGPITEQHPASLLRRHRNVTAVLDAAAARRLA